MLAPISSVPSPPSQMKNQTYFQIQQGSGTSNRTKALVLVNPGSNPIQTKRTAQSNERKIQVNDSNDGIAFSGKLQGSGSPQSNAMNQFIIGQSPHSANSNVIHPSFMAQNYMNSKSGGDTTPTGRSRSGAGTTSASRTKQKLFNNLNNYSPKSPTANLPSSIIGSPPSAQNNSRHTKNTKLHSFFDQRRQTGTQNNAFAGTPGIVADIFKKPRAITNENLQENSVRGIRQKALILQSPSSIEVEEEQQGNLTAETILNGQNQNGELKKSLRCFQNQTVLSHSQQQQQVQHTISQSPKQHNMPQKPESQTSNGHGDLNQFITRVAKGEILGQPSGVLSSGTSSKQQNNNKAIQSSSSNAYQTLIPLSIGVNSPNNYNSNSDSNNSTPLSNMQIAFTKSTKESKTSRSKVPQLFLGTRVLKKLDRNFAGPVTLEPVPSSSSSNSNNNYNGNISARNASVKTAQKKVVQNRSVVSSIRTAANSQRNGNIRLIGGLKREQPSSILDASQGLNDSSTAMDIEGIGEFKQRDNSILHHKDLNDSGAYIQSPLKAQLNIQTKNTPKPTPYYNPSMISALKNKAPTHIKHDAYFEQLYKEHFIQSFHSLHFCKTIKPVPSYVLEQKKVNLAIHPKNQGKKTIVFDLDETLIHCNESPEIHSDVIVPIKFPNNEVINAGINIRPYAKECLQELSKHFEIIVFTASHGCYAVKVLEELDPENKYISHRLFRESCVQTEEGVHIKDMRVFANRNLKDLVLVDNAAYSFALQVHNGIPIVPYYYNKEDQELKHLQAYLLSNILESTDVREVNKQYFKMHLYNTADRIELAAKKIYSI